MTFIQSLIMEKQLIVKRYALKTRLKAFIYNNPQKWEFDESDR